MKLVERLNVFIKYLPLLIEFVERDIKTRYRRSILGLFWTLLNPLLTMIVMTVVFSQIFKSNIIHFPVYLLAAQIIINYFSESTSNSMTSIISGSSLIKKIYIPKYLFPLSKVIAPLVNWSASFIALLTVMLVTGVTIRPTILLVFIPIFAIFILAFGVGLILSSISMYFRDTIHFYGVLLLLLNYMTPLFYPIEILPLKTMLLVQLNPLTNIVEYFRLITLYGVIPPLYLAIMCLLPGIVMVIIGLWIFYCKQDEFILLM